MSEKLFVTHRHISKFDISKPVVIRPFGDVHRDSPNCDVDRWREWLKYCEKTDTPQTFYIGMGDYLDFASEGERTKLKSDKIHGSTIDRFERAIKRDVADLASELSFMSGRLLGLIGGNHEWDFEDGTNATQLLGKHLGCKYLGWLAYVRLSLTNKTTADNQRKGSLDLFVSHGRASGKLAGSPINSVDDMRRICNSADFYGMGHDHQKMVKEETSLHFPTSKCSDLIMTQRQQYLFRSGAFLRSYMPNSKSYAISALYRPSSLGTVEFEVRFRTRKKSIDGKNREIVRKEIKATS